MVIVYTGGTHPFPKSPSSISSKDIHDAARAAGRPGWTYSAQSWVGKNVYDSTGKTVYVVPASVDWDYFRGKYAGYTYICCPCAGTGCGGGGGTECHNCATGCPGGGSCGG